MEYPTSPPPSFGRARGRRPRLPWNALSSLQKVNRVFSWAMIAVSLCCVVVFIRGSLLIDRPSWTWWAYIFFSGAIMGVCYFLFSDSVEGRGTRIPLYVFGAFIFGVFFTVDSSLIEEVYAFTGVPPRNMDVLSPVTGAQCNVHNNLKGFRLNVAPFADSGQVSIRVTNGLCQRFTSESYDGHDCLLLDVETGRNNIRRVSLPLFAMLDEDRVRRCPGF